VGLGCGTDYIPMYQKHFNAVFLTYDHIKEDLLNPKNENHKRTYKPFNTRTA